MFYLLLSSTKGKRNRFRKRVRVKSSIQFEWRHCKKNNNTFLNHCAQDNFNSWLEFKATGCNKLRIRLQVISTKRSVQIFWFALGSKQPLNSDMCSQCSLHSSSAHYQINRKPTGNTERLLLLLFLKFCLEIKICFHEAPTRTHLVVWSPSATARWTSQTTLLRQTRHSSTRSTGRWVGLLGCHALGQLSQAELRATSQSARAILICVIYLPDIFFLTVNCAHRTQQRGLLCLNEPHRIKRWIMMCLSAVEEIFWSFTEVKVAIFPYKNSPLQVN